MAGRASENANGTNQILAIGLGLPNVESGVACAGTSLESATVTVRKKSFLFVRATEIRLKLDASKGEFETLAKKDPKSLAIGAGGWATIRLQAGGTFPSGVTLSRIEKWIRESYAVFGGEKAAPEPAPQRTGKAEPGKKRKAAK